MIHGQKSVLWRESQGYAEQRSASVSQRPHAQSDQAQRGSGRRVGASVRKATNHLAEEELEITEMCFIQGRCGKESNEVNFQAKTGDAQAFLGCYTPGSTRLE